MAYDVVDDGMGRYWICSYMGGVFVVAKEKLLNATDMAIEMKQKGVLGKPCPDYVDETVSMKVVRIIQGYVNVVNKMVWRKY